MGDDDDKDNKTEDPTHKRLEEAREKGQIPTSKEVNNFFLLFVLALILLTLTPPLAKQLMALLVPFMSRPEDIDFEIGSLRLLFVHVAGQVALMLVVPMLLALVAVIAAGGLQTRFNVSTESLVPKLDKISPMKGLTRMFSRKSVVELLKGIIKLTIVGSVATIAIWPSMPQMQKLPDMEIMAIITLTMVLAKRMLIGILCALFIIAIMDYAYQRFEHIKGLRMTKQEVRDEYKQQEGDPTVKGKLKQIRAERSRKRMMAQVPQSDVVVTNPTHYAIALKYEQGTMAAPKVLAKGADKVAQRIKDIAAEHKIPVLRNPPLARALYANAEVDEEIPLEYYQAVAQVIGYVYKLKGKAPKQLNLPKGGIKKS